MNKKEQIAYWIELADYDIETAQAMYDTKLVKLMSEEQAMFISYMMPMNIEARYPSYKEKMFRSLTPESCKEMLDTTKEILLWIKSKL